jgi:hypothetical protein
MGRKSFKEYCSPLLGKNNRAHLLKQQKLKKNDRTCSIVNNLSRRFRQAGNSIW